MPGHALVIGGPGSGKTTIALLKAIQRIQEGLEIGQQIAFLSFSKAAVARIAEAAVRDVSTSQRTALNIQTFHAFFWDILRTHGYLLGAPRPLRILLPHDEKALSKGIEQDDSPAWQAWEPQRQRLFHEEGRVVFDLFAPQTAQLLSRRSSIRRLVAKRYPLIIVDEAQDTGPDQWACIKALAIGSQIVCLADLDQQIFDHLPGIGPERIAEIENDLRPTRVDLGDENNRSPACEIVAFGNDLLGGKARPGPYEGVTHVRYHPKTESRDKYIRQSIGRAHSIVHKQTGRVPRSIAVLASYDRGVRIISKALNESGKPIAHKVHFDETATLLASRFLAFLMEPKRPGDQAGDLAEALKLLASIYRANGAKGALLQAEQFLLWAQKTGEPKAPTKAKLYNALAALVMNLQKTKFCGDPRKDWMSLRGALRISGVPAFAQIDRHLQYLMAFNRGKRIASGLSTAWESSGSYKFARQILDAALAQDQIMAGNDTLAGIHVMNMHKSKGKQFDAVIIYRDHYNAPFVWPGDTTPFTRSCKILRVAVTRASAHTIILDQVFPPCPIISKYRL